MKTIRKKKEGGGLVSAVRMAVIMPAVLIIICLLSSGNIYARESTVPGGSAVLNDPDEDDWEDDDDDDYDDDWDDDDPEEYEPEEERPGESLNDRGYRYGYIEGKKDGLHDCMLKEYEAGNRAYQVIDEDSLYYLVTDPDSTEDYNDRIGYPEVPVSANELIQYGEYALKWQEGYRDGYNYNIGEGAEEAWYNKGHTFGYLDAVNDTYDPEESHGDEERIVKNGYYEPDYKDSTYNTLQGKYGEAYRAGYDAGWKDGINELSYSIDYSSPDFDPWRITACPLKWDTSDSFIVQTGREYGNSFFDVKSGCFFTVSGDYVEGRTAAYSPFDWFFISGDTFVKDGHVIDRKNGALIQGVNTVVTAGGGYLYRAVEAGEGLYVLIRYRVGSHSDYKNMKVRRYIYKKENGDRGAIIRTAVTDGINNYYCETEPVVAYDSRRIEDAGRRIREGSEENAKNTRSRRREIAVDAVLVHWQEGERAELLGEIRFKADAKNNRFASVSSDHIAYRGSPNIFGQSIEEKYRYYVVSAKKAYDDEDRELELFPAVSYISPEFYGKLTKEDNKKLQGDGPYFRLKLTGLDKGIKRYKKLILNSVKNEVFRFEIARFPISSTKTVSSTYKPYVRSFSRNSEFARKAAEILPEAPRRRDYADYEEYLKAVEEYETKKKEAEEYFGSEEYKNGFALELKEARKAYMADYYALMDKYGKNMNGFAAFLENEVLVNYVPYTYKRKYSEGYYRDGNKDGTVTEMEQWEYDYLYGPDALDKPEHPEFNGKLDPGENVIPDKNAYDAEYTGLPEMKDVAWLHGTSYFAVTTVYLDHDPGEGFETAGSDSILNYRTELNQTAYTMNEDARLSLGELRIKKKKGKSILKISPAFVFYMGEDEDGEYTHTVKERIRTDKDGSDLVLTEKNADGEAILLIHGENNLEGDIAVRRRPTGEAGFGLWRDDEHNYIAEDGRGQE